MTIKEIIKIASGNYFMILLDEINKKARNMHSMTKYEQEEAKKEMQRLAKMIRDGVKND